MPIGDIEKNNTLPAHWVIGTVVIPEPAKLKTLCAYTSANHATPREVGVYTGGYLVPNSKKFVVVAARVVTAAAAGNYMYIGTATSDINFANTAPSGTDIITAFGNFHITTIAQELVEKGHSVVVPAGRYLHVSNVSGEAFWTIYGYEIDATAIDV